MKKNPEVTAIIPAYNIAKVIPRTIKSVLNQTFKDFELIVVDDGSTDNTGEVVKKICKKDSRVIYIHQKNSGGPPGPKNTGIKNARGKFIAFLDHDDEWMPKKIEKQVEIFKDSKKKNVGFVSCDAILIDVLRKKTVEYNLPKYKDVYKELLKRNFISSSSSIMVRKDVLDKIGLFDENMKYMDDRDMWIRIAEKYDFDSVELPLLKYYIYEGNTTKILGVKKRIADIEYLYKKHKKKYKKFPEALSTLFSFMGAIYLSGGKMKQARSSFLRSIKKNPLNFKSYIYLFISIFGARFYIFTCNLKFKMMKYRIFNKIIR